MRTCFILASCLLCWACDDADSSDDPMDGLPLPDLARPDATPPDAAPLDQTVPDATAPDMAAPPPDIEWTPCPLTGEAHRRTTCAEIDVPLRHADPDGPHITLFIKRIAPDSPDGRSIWLLAGGPGQAGDALEPLGKQLSTTEPRLTIYLPDHRGTGRSSRLSCPRAEHVDSPGGLTILTPEWPDCAAEVAETWSAEELAGFSATEAALDLRELIDRMGEPAPFLLGISYGTFLAWRYLQIAPDQAAGVMFDSACKPGICHLSAQDTWEDAVGRAWFDGVCAGDPLCAEKLGEVPSEAVAQLHAMLDAGHCPLLGGDPVQARATLRLVLAQLLFFAQLRPLLPAFVYRMLRCEPADQQAIAHLFNAVFGGGGGIPSSYSWPLAMNILVSEMWEPDDPAPEVLTDRYAETLMCRGVSNQVAHQAPEWMRYRYAEPLLDAEVATDTPTLIIQAEYDPATPVEYARPMTASLSGPNQRFVVVEHASHAVVSQSPLDADPQTQCGFLMLRAFLQDPTGALPDCANATRAPNFAGNPMYNLAVFGTADLWEN